MLVQTTALQSGFWSCVFVQFLADLHKNYWMDFKLGGTMSEGRTPLNTKAGVGISNLGTDEPGWSFVFK